MENQMRFFSTFISGSDWGRRRCRRRNSGDSRDAAALQRRGRQRVGAGRTADRRPTQRPTARRQPPELAGTRAAPRRRRQWTRRRCRSAP